MIVFLGDSFTWGQGLPIEKWIQTDNLSFKECNKFSPPEYSCESYNYEDDNYRKQNHFPNLVAQHFNKSYVTKFGNGGNNNDIVDILQNFGCHFVDIRGIDYFVIQFTDFVRDPYFSFTQSIIHEQGDSFKFNKDLDKFFEDYIKKQIEQIDDCLKDINKKWFGFSWREDYGKILKQYYPSNYIPLSHNNKLYNNFGKILQDDHYLTLAGKWDGIEDGHMNSDGHRVIANSIINKINSYL
jgi:lysophospholipase L1-like esterase|tara:strand:+ start:131 stop:850 length:720 start_codon:yes stop_codon:yes gene_type:complete